MLRCTVKRWNSETAGRQSLFFGFLNVFFWQVTQPTTQPCSGMCVYEGLGNQINLTEDCNKNLPVFSLYSFCKNLLKSSHNVWWELILSWHYKDHIKYIRINWTPTYSSRLSPSTICILGDFVILFWYQTKTPVDRVMAGTDWDGLDEFVLWTNKAIKLQLLIALHTVCLQREYFTIIVLFCISVQKLCKKELCYNTA